MSKLRKYIIYRIDDACKDKVFPKKIVMQRFYADDDNEAYEKLKDFRKIANKTYTYYYKEVFEQVTVDDDGKKHVYEDVDEMHRRLCEEKGTWDKLCIWLRVKWSDVKDKWYKMKYLWYYIKTGHEYKASWSLDCFLLREIVWNLKRLKTDTHGCVVYFLDQARKQLHKDDKDFDLEKYNNEHYEYTDEEFKLAVKIRTEEYDKVIEHILLYDYYSNFGIVNCELVDDTEAFEAKWKSTLPIKPGTYRSFDYDKLDALAKEHWNFTWNWIKEHGQKLWD